MYPTNPTKPLPFLRRFFALAFSAFLLCGWLSVAQAAQSVSLKWNSNPGDIDGYRVYQGDNSGEYTDAFDVGNTTSATISNLTSGNTYFFVVTAYNSAGESQPSDEISFVAADTPVEGDGSGLTGFNIGQATGDSSEVSTGVWSLSSSGIGVGGSVDNVYFKSAKQSGDFQALVRIQSLTNNGSDPMVGLMLRESLATNARFAMVAATPKGFSYASRTNAGANATTTKINVSMKFPNVWVLIQRTGDKVDFATSSDGINFDFVGSTVIASLVKDIDLGLFASSGSTGVSTSAVVSDYNVIPLNGATLPVTSGLVTRLESDQGVNVSGSKVNTWTDSSASQNTLFAGGDPQYVAGATPGGLPAIELDGAGDKLERVNTTHPVLGLPLANANRTMFVVVKYDASSSPGWAGVTYGNGASNEAFGFAVSNEKNQPLVLQGWGGGNDLVSNEAGPGAGWLVESAVLNGGTATLYKDGVSIASWNHNYDTKLTKLVVGEEINNLGFVDMDIAAVIIYDRALNNTERQEVENYLQAKYLIGAN